MSFFTAISTAITKASHRLHIDVEGIEGGKIKVLLSTNLGPTPDNASASEVQLRAALAKPLLVSGTPEEVEAALLERVQTHATAINEGTRLLDEIRSIGVKAVEDAKAKSAKNQPAAAVAADSDDDESGEDTPDDASTKAPAAASATALSAPAPTDKFDLSTF